MPRKVKAPIISCDNFHWRLFQRDGVYYADGRSRRRNLGKHSLATRDYDTALVNLRRLDQKLAADLGLIPAPVSQAHESIGIEAGWNLYLEHCERPDTLGGATPQSIAQYRNVARKHAAYCQKHGPLSWNDVTPSHIEKYAGHLAKKNAERTVYFECRMLLTVNKHLVDRRLLPPAHRIQYRLRRPEGTETYCPTVAEVTAMIDYCRSVPTLSWFGDLLMVLIYTGLRISEAAGLRWSDFDSQLESLTLTDERASSRRKKLGNVRTTKGRRGRTIPLHHELSRMLQNMPRWSDGLVLHDPCGGPLEYDVVYTTLLNDVLQPLAKRFPVPPGEVGFSSTRPHSFRHFFCSQTFLGGASEGEVMDWMGHTCSKMVARYRHIREQDSRRRMQQINFVDAVPDVPAAV